MGKRDKIKDTETQREFSGVLLHEDTKPVFHLRAHLTLMGFAGGSDGKESAHNVRDRGSIPGSGRFPGKGNGTPLQSSCLGNPMDGGAWWPTVHRIAKSQTRLSDFTIFTFGSFYTYRIKCIYKTNRLTDFVFISLVSKGKGWGG